MKVTNVNIVKPLAKEQTRFRALVTVELDNAIVISNMRLIEEDGSKYFLAMPSIERRRKCKSCGNKLSFRHQYCPYCGKENVVNLAAARYKDVVKLIDKKLEEEILKFVIEKYKQLIAK